MNKTRKYFKKNRGQIILLISIITALSLYIGVIEGRKYWDRKQLGSVEQSLQNLTSALKEKNISIDGEVKKYCRQDQEKFGGGKKSCAVEINFQEIQSAQVDETSIKLQEIMTGLKGEFSPRFERSIDLSEQHNATFSYEHTSTGIGCAYRYGKSSLSENTTLRFFCFKYVNNYIY